MAMKNFDVRYWRFLIGPFVVCAASPEYRSLANHMIIRVDSKSMPTINHCQQRQLRIWCSLFLWNDRKSKLIQEIVREQERFRSFAENVVAGFSYSSFEFFSLLGDHQFVEVGCGLGVLSDLYSSARIQHCQA